MTICNWRTLWWPSLLPLLAATIAVGTDAWVVAGFLPDLAHDMDVTISQAGWSVTAFAIAYAVGAPVLAATTSTIRTKQVISTALIVLAIANGLCAISSSFTMLLSGRVLAALAASVVTPAAGVLAARVAGAERRGMALSLVISGLTIATAIGVPLGSALAALSSWRAALGAVAGLAAVAAVLIALTAPDPVAGARQSIRDRLEPLRYRRVLAILGLTTLGMSAAYVPYAYIAELVPTSSEHWLVLVLITYGVGAVTGSLGSGALTDRFGSAPTLTGAYAVMVAALVGLALRPPVELVAALALAWGAASWMQTPPQQHRLLATAPEHGPVTIGANASALYGGIALGNAIGGLLLPHGAALMCLGAAIGAGLALAWNLRLKQPGMAATTARLGAD